MWWPFLQNNADNKVQNCFITGWQNKFEDTNQSGVLKFIWLEFEQVSKFEQVWLEQV